MTELLPLVAGAYQLRAGSNIGLLVRDGQALAIDAGLDGSAAKDVLRALGGLGARLTAILITHAHADHFGGAADLARRAGAEVYAAALEAAVISNPLLEPLYLYSGAAPIQELTHKFTLAKPCAVQHIVEAGRRQIGPFDLEIVPLAGHAPAQIGVRWGEVLFTADAFFPVETLHKHGIPFCADLDAALRTLDAIGGLPARCYAPGHGPALESPAAALAANRARLERIRALCLEALADGPAEPAEIVARVAAGLEAALSEPVGYFLGQTTVLAALTSCQRAGLAQAVVAGGRLRWSRPE